MNEKDLIEKLADLEHKQWISWSKDLASREVSLSEERVRRWKDFWVPYQELEEDIKEMDRVWARKVISILKQGGHI